MSVSTHPKRQTPDQLAVPSADEGLCGEAQEEILAAGRSVLSLESEAILALRESLNTSFASAVSVLERVPGRVIVAGIGKSGHVARKIAATLASTGTPSQFVHPTEASHGDMGMITKEDAVIALSNSGETKELSDLLLHCKRFSIPLLAITSKPESTLAQYADIVLVTPAKPEAGTMGLAPTTSTTVTMALGDALAVALLERKGFTKRDFGVLHPGGSLGRQLLRAKELMHGGDQMPLAQSGQKMSDALTQLTGKRFGCAGVVDTAGQLIGIITDGDLRRHMDADLLEKTVDQVMTHSPITAGPDDLAVELISQMNAKTIIAVFVVEKGVPVGVLHLHDMIQAAIA